MPIKRTDQFIMGRVIRAVGKSWHPACFKCESCQVELADIGFLRINKKSVSFIHILFYDKTKFIKNYD